MPEATFFKLPGAVSLAGRRALSISGKTPAYTPVGQGAGAGRSCLPVGGRQRMPSGWGAGKMMTRSTHKSMRKGLPAGPRGPLGPSALSWGPRPWRLTLQASQRPCPPAPRAAVRYGQAPRPQAPLSLGLGPRTLPFAPANLGWVTVLVPSPARALLLTPPGTPLGTANAGDPSRCAPEGRGEHTAGTGCPGSREFCVPECSWGCGESEGQCSRAPGVETQIQSL